MNKYTTKENLITEFMIDLFKLTDINKKSGHNFYNQTSLGMLLGKELDNHELYNPNFFEELLMYNLYKNNPKTKNISSWSLLNPFVKIPNNYYYKIFFENPLIFYQNFMIGDIVEEIEENDEIPITLLNLKNKGILHAYSSFLKMQTIMRNGWIIRGVDEKNYESDAIHIMQMFALANACFQIYDIKDIDKQKVYDMIFIHEIGEVIAGDIMEIDKNHDNKHDIERKSVLDTFSNLKYGEYFINLWDEFEERKTEEAKFVYELDKIDPVIKSLYLDYILERNDLFNDFYSFEEKRKTFNDSRLKPLFLNLKPYRGELKNGK